jgi:hypothetical protein
LNVAAEVVSLAWRTVNVLREIVSLGWRTVNVLRDIVSLGWRTVDVLRDIVSLAWRTMNVLHEFVNVLRKPAILGRFRSRGSGTRYCFNQRSNQSPTVWNHNFEFCGFKTQCPSSG